MDHLKDCHTVLISGCGGGYDIFCGLDLFFELHAKGYQVILGSYSFTDNKLIKRYGCQIDPHCYRITHSVNFNEQEYIEECTKEIKIPPVSVLQQIGYTADEYVRSQLGIYGDEARKVYFPELKMVQYLYDHYQIEVPIYCFIDGTVKTLTQAYNAVVLLERPDTIILIDGGTDSLMTGSEKGSLGTPYEDICSIIAVHDVLHVNKKFLYLMGFNIEQHVTDDNVLHNIAHLTQQGHFIGAYAINKQRESTRRYVETFMHCDPVNSIVNTAIVASLNGEYGNVCPRWIQCRLRDETIKVTPFMSFYWICDLDGVFHNLTYDVEKMRTATGAWEVSQLIIGEAL